MELVNLIVIAFIATFLATIHTRASEPKDEGIFAGVLVLGVFGWVLFALTV